MLWPQLDSTIAELCAFFFQVMVFKFHIQTVGPVSIQLQILKDHGTFFQASSVGAADAEVDRWLELPGDPEK